MPMQKKCLQCGMIFPTDDALSKHKTRFCIGVKDSGIGRKYNHSDNRHTKSNYPYDRPSSGRPAKYQSQIDKKRDEINNWKTKRSMLRDIKDMEDRIFYDSQKTRKLATNRKKQTDDYDRLRSEYNRLDAQERDLLRQMSNLQKPLGSHAYQPDGLTSHERNQLEALKRDNARLEQERRLVQIKLRKLMLDNDQSSSPPNYEPPRYVRDTQNQQKFPVYYNERRAHSTDVPSLPYFQSPRQTSLDDVRNVRNDYLQSGGHNAAVLSSYADMERRLTQYEHYPWLKDRPEPLSRQRYYAIPAMPAIDTTPNKLALAKDENHRLQNELDDIRRRFQGLDSRTKKLELSLSPSRVSEPISNDFYNDPPSKVNGYSPMNSLIHPYSRQYNNRSPSPTIGRRMSTYDPVDGFVIFFDFIANISPTIDRIRLITCLHHEQTGLGEPSQLDSCRCELSVDERTGESMRIAFVATKQPVPRCPPQQALKIIIETQVTLKQIPTEPFHTAAWTKMPTFDHNNRLLTGRWKIPLKALPIQHDERLSVIGSLPTFGSAELYYRLVNLRDAAEQSNAALLPKSKDLYSYPPQD